MSLQPKLILPTLAANLGLAGYLLYAWLPEYASEPFDAFSALLPLLLFWLAAVSGLLWANVAYLHQRLQRLARQAQGDAQPPPGHDQGDALDQCAAQIDSLQHKLRDSQAARERLNNLYRQSEENLRESEERYVIAVRGANDGAMEWDVANGEMLYSPRWKSMLGLDGASLDSNIDEWYSRIHADDYPRTRSALQQLLDGKTTLFENEHRLRHASGEYLWVAARAVVIRSASGKAIKLIAVLSDITDKKLVQQLLNEVEDGLDNVTGDEFFRRLVKNLACALNTKYAFITECLPGPDGKPNRVRSIAFWTGQGFVENIEYDLDGTPCQEVIEEGTTCFYPMGLAQRYPKEAGLESYVGIAVLGPGGQVVGHLACLDPAPMRNNLPIQSVQKLFAMRASAEIIRMTLEKSLQVSQQVNRAICDSVDELVLLANPHGMLETINHTAEKLCGLRQEEIAHYPLERVLARTEGSMQGRHGLLEALTAHVGKTSVQRYCLINKQGRVHEMEGVVTPIHDAQHRLEKIVVVGRPVA